MMKFPDASLAALGLYTGETVWQDDLILLAGDILREDLQS